MEVHILEYDGKVSSLGFKKFEDIVEHIEEKEKGLVRVEPCVWENKEGKLYKIRFVKIK